ncbi:MAG: hypothetical protein JWQ38_194 [Flavipsychrobacter sp.]|nr:hypothetical protein [Flavipsychrobacter sp.]
MKAIDFTQPGGFPLTQDQLDYLQSAYTECLNTLGCLGSNNSTPAMLSGMESTPGIGGSTNVSAGWFFYNGELVRFPAQSYPAVSPGNAMYVVITPGAGPLTYHDGSTPNVILEKTGLLLQLVNTTPTDATHFLLDDIIPFGVGLGLNNREASWNSLVVNTLPAVGGVTGTIFYKKNSLTNTLHIRANLAANNAQNFPPSTAAIYSLMGTLPAGYVPNNIALFTASYFASFLIKDDLGVAWVKQVNCAVNTGGQIFVNWLRPDISIGAYGLDFNTIIPLD